MSQPSKTITTGQRLAKKYEGKSLLEILDDLKAHYAISSQQVLSYCLASWYEKEATPEFKEYIEGLRKFSKDLKVEIDTAREENKKTEKQEANWLTWSQIVTLRDLWKTQEAKSHRNHQCYLALCAYTFLPPQRLNWCNVFIVPEGETPPETGNYMTSTEVTFRDYKTAKNYGTLTLPLPKVFQEVVAASLEKYPRRYLFGHRNHNTPFTPAALSHLLMEAFAPTGRQAAANLIRHSYASFIHADKPSVAEETAEAKKMGHSATQSRLYAKK